MYFQRCITSCWMLQSSLQRMLHRRSQLPTLHLFVLDAATWRGLRVRCPSRLEPLRHIQRTLGVEGDVRETLPQYLENNPHTVVALACFDLDLYEPTRAVLEKIRPYLTKGSIVAFDELAHAKWPGETSALRDTLRTDACRLRLLPGHATPAYLIWEG